VTARDLLLARGWREVAPGLWSHPDPRRDHRPRVGNLTSDAEQQCEREAINDAREHGSVTYRATAEQVQTSPLLAQCAALGMTERDVIEHLFLHVEELRRVVLKRAETHPVPFIFTIDMTAEQLQAEAEEQRKIAAGAISMAEEMERRLRRRRANDAARDL
jgi:hypothetical protein